MDAIETVLEWCLVWLASQHKTHTLAIFPKADKDRYFHLFNLEPHSLVTAELWKLTAECLCGQVCQEKWASRGHEDFLAPMESMAKLGRKEILDQWDPKVKKKKRRQTPSNAQNTVPCCSSVPELHQSVLHLIDQSKSGGVNLPFPL